ncbi:hypothetical protein BDR05DRAFT_42841 [Suillus weaverae]|nr:hypothetical protein BDR05DRAFT_42841 [Suillus weaverae]
MTLVSQPLDLTLKTVTDGYQTRPISSYSEICRGDIILLLSKITVSPDGHTVMTSNKSAPSAESVVTRSLWQSYKALPARTRLYVSMAVCSVGAVGIYVSDYLEEKYPVAPPRTAAAHVAPPSSRNAAGTA